MKHSITCFCKFFVILIMTFSLYGCKNYDVEPFMIEFTQSKQLMELMMKIYLIKTQL